MRETINYKLKKPDPTEFFDMENHINYNADIIDVAIKGVKDVADSKAPSTHTHDAKDINGIKTDAKSIPIEDATNVFIATDVEGALLETKTSISEQRKEIDSLKQSVSDGKSVVASAITDKGVPTLATDTFQKMATNITNIKDMPIGWDLEELGEVTGSNIVENDAIVWQKYGNCDSQVEPLLTQPSISVGVRQQIAFDKQGKFFAMAGSVEPYMNVFKVENDVFTKLPNPAILPGGSSHLCAFSPNGKYFVICAGVYLNIYTIEGETFTRLTNISTNNGSVAKVKFSNDGKYLAFVGYADNFIRVYKINTTTNTFTAVMTMSSYAYKSDLAFSPDSKLLHVTSETDYTVTYELSDTANPTQISVPVIGGIVTGMTYSNAGDLLVASSSATSSGLIVYTASGKMFTRLEGVIDVLPSKCYNLVFTPDDNYLIMSTTSTAIPSLYIYKRTGNTFKLITPISNPPSHARYIDVSADGKYLAVQNSTNTTLIYRTQEKAMVMNYSIPNLPMFIMKDRYVGIAQESKNIGEQINVNLFPKLNIV